MTATDLPMAMPLFAALVALGLLVVVLGALLLHLASRLRASRTAVAESEHRLLLALDGAGHGVWDWNAETGRVFYSRRWKEMLGYREDEISDDPREWSDRLHPHDRELALQRTDHHGRNRKPFYSSIYRLRAKDGSWRWILGQGIALERDAAGYARRTIGTHTDVTQWREAELAREASQQRFEATFEQAAVGMAHIAPDGHFLLVNGKLAELLGYAADELVEQRYQALTHADDRTHEQALIARLLAGGIDHYTLEKRVLRADAAELWTQTTMSLKRDEVGDPDYLIAVIEDIRGRKRIERQLRLAAQVMRDAAYAIITTDLDGRITDLNPAAEALLQCTAAELAPATSPVAFLDSAEVEARAETLARQLGRPVAASFQVLSAAALMSGRDTREWTLQTAAGGQTPVLVSITALRDEDERPIGFVANLADISAQRESAEALRAERNRAQWYLDTVNALIVSLDPRGRITLVNRYACQVLGCDESALLGRDWFASCLPADASAAARALFQRAIEGEADAAPYNEGPIRAAGDEVRLIGWHNSQMRDESGRLVGLLAAGNDITDRRAMEEARATAVAEAERLAALKSAFLANMSHEIRTPLHALLGLARIGRRPQPSRPHTELCARIEDAGNHLLGVINDVLDFSKLEAGKLRIEPQVFHLADRISRAAALVQPQAQAKQLALAVNPEPGLPEWVYGDALRLGQILINLLGNAVKFTERGRIVLEVARAGDQIAFSVIDSGVGIAEDDLARLFTPFEQIDPSSSRSHGGSGLGLAISRNLAQMMGGTLAATSEPGVGSRFELRLPLPARSAPLAPAVPAAASERSAARLVGLHLLVVDDVEVNRLIVEDLLAQEGASAVSVADGASAVAAACAADAAFDAVLMDIQMPGMDGYEAARRIRAQRPSLPVIGLTAHAMADDSGTEGASALAARLPKPLESERLVAELSRLGGADGDGSDASHPRPAARERLASAGAAGAGGSAAEQVRAGATAAVGQAEAENAASASVIDWAALEARFAASPGFVARVIDTALRSAADAPAELRRLAADGDLDGFYRSSHGIKGLAGNLSAESLYQLADELCEAAQRGDRSVLARGEGFAVEVERLLRALADRRQSRGDGEGSPG